MAREGLLLGLLVWSAVASTTIRDPAAAILHTQDVAQAYDQHLEQSPWPAGDLQGQWHQRQRSLLQNPDRPTASWNGRKGAIEGGWDASAARGCDDM